MHFRLILLLMPVFALAQERKIQEPAHGFSVVEKLTEKKVDVLFDGRPLTSYTWLDSLFKPVLYPINTFSGIPITRRFPLSLVPGEPADHPHQVGLFFTHESVNGFDFWNLSQAIPPSKRNNYGRIEHVSILEKKSEGTTAHLTVLLLWKTYGGEVLMEETTRFNFQIANNDFIIDRQTSLKAIGKKIIFKDAKDALLGLRVARELELPNEWKVPFVQQDGTLSSPMVDNSQATGNYFNSEGVKGEAVWGVRSKWVCLTGEKTRSKISIVIFDHPKNLEYPSFWHARSYGLFAINPLGKKIFAKNEDLNFSLQEGSSQSFHYRILIHEGEILSPERIEKLANTFVTGSR